MALKTRAEALKCGDRKYQGRPCQYGHDGARYITSRACVKCECTRKRKDSDERRAVRVHQKDPTAYGRRVLMLGTYNP